MAAEPVRESLDQGGLAILASDANVLGDQVPGWYGVDERSPDSHAAEEERSATERARKLAESGAEYAEDEELREAEGDQPDRRPEDVH